jgi:acetyl-CoA carboxylase carboxyltransferase component
MSDDWSEVIADLAERRVAARAMGGPERIARQRDKGRLEARARIDALLDPGTFTEIGLLAGEVPGDGVVTGTGEIGGVQAAVVAEDFTVAGGSIGEVNTAKRHRLVTLAVQERLALVVLLDGAGHRPHLPTDQPPVRKPNDLQALADARFRIPIACAVMGPAAGHSALAAPMSDFSVMTAGAAIFTAGPPLVRASLGEDVDQLTLGGPGVALRSGVIHNGAADDLDAIDQIRDWLAYLAAPHCPPDGPHDRPVTELTSIVPRSARQPYDMRRVIAVVVDEASWFEIQPEYGASLLTGLARLGGRTVAVVANQPLHLGGALDAAAGDKGERFIGFADAFRLPLVFLTDNPGVMAGTQAERTGVLSRAGRMFVAQHRATVPKLQVTLRKAYGFGSTVMAMNPFGGQTLNVAFPGVTFGAMPTRGADEATGADEERRDAMLHAELESGYRSARGASLDDLIAPDELRDVLLAGLRRASARLPSKGAWT